MNPDRRPRRGHGRMRGARVAALAVLSVLMASCGLFGPGHYADPQFGRVAVVFVNKTDSIVQVLLAATANGKSAGEWLVPVAPQGWESLLLDCDIEQLVLLGAEVLASLDDPNSTLVAYTGDPIRLGHEYDCGSVVDVRVETAPRPTTRQPVVTSMSVQRRDSADLTTDLGDDGFIVIDAAGPKGVPAQLSIAWVDGTSRRYESHITLTGRESGFGILLRCPVDVFTLGLISDPNAPLGTVDGVPVFATPTTFNAVPCGGVLALRVVAAPQGSPTPYVINATLDADIKSAVARTLNGVSRVLTSAQAPFLPTNSLQLLPTPANQP